MYCRPYKASDKLVRKIKCLSKGDKRKILDMILSEGLEDTKKWMKR